MSQPSSFFRDRQEQQLARFLDWMSKQPGAIGRELPVQLDTLLKPEQERRIQWLKERVIGRTLEVGCSWGYLLAKVGGHAGVDISPGPIAIACLLAPERQFYVADACSLPFRDGEFDTVVIAETLEHLDPVLEVPQALREATRVARKRVLVTIPDGREDSPEATNFKHRWLCDEKRRKGIEAIWVMDVQSSFDIVPGFLCAEANRK